MLHQIVFDKYNLKQIKDACVLFWCLYKFLSSNEWKNFTANAQQNTAELFRSPKIKDYGGFYIDKVGLT